MIAHRFRPVVWVVGCAFAATALYTVSLSVAAERARLEKVDQQIADTQSDIRQLQTEMGTRASLRQLERWNSEVLALGAPKAGQFRATETALQTLDGGTLPAGAGAPAPVMMAAATPVAVPAPVAAAQPVSAPVQTAQATPAAKPVAPAVKAAAAPKAVVSPKAVALASAEPRPARPAAVAKTPAKPVSAKSDATKPQRFAMLDRKLVDQRTFSEILVRAANESQAGGGKGKSAQ